jgi:hypothetical protein
VWLLGPIGYPQTRDAAIRFDGIEPMWLWSLTKQWLRWRLSTGIAIGTVTADMRALTLFARCNADPKRSPVSR